MAKILKNFRVTAVESEQIDQMAAEAGYSNISAFIRDRIFDNSMPFKSATSEIAYACWELFNTDYAVINRAVARFVTPEDFFLRIYDPKRSQISLNVIPCIAAIWVQIGVRGGVYDVKIPYSIGSKYDIVRTVLSEIKSLISENINTLIDEI